jgi:hypothetical protein
MFRSIGLPELLIPLFVLVFVPFVWGKIFSRAGYSPWLGLTILIPVVNQIALCYRALSEWPIQSELARFRQPTPPVPPATHI